jgi:hypothetical protein
MQRATSPVLAARITEQSAARAAVPHVPAQRQVPAQQVPAQHVPAQRQVRAQRNAGRPGQAVRGRRRLRRALAGLGDSCALAGVALLACVAVIAVGTAGSLLWMFLLER